ncbi:MAG: T9SS C-terminal target domain-containing protein [Calditrichaeota bacterium]|nr:MAG: T9SS C-terminal target domain-containing protein [Calditrichota bacterium]
MKSFFKHLLIFILTSNSWSQEQFPWPVEPFHASHEITGNFAEFRDTGSADHFHNGTDIPKPDGSPVYPVKDGIITSIGRVSSQGNNAFVRVQDMAYVHIDPNPVLAVGDSVFASQTVLGTILPGLGHVHFTNGFLGAEKNSMLENRGLTPLEDPWPPIIRFVRFYQNETTLQFPSTTLSGLVDIVVKVDEQNGPPTSRISRRNNGTYKIGYKILNADTSAVIFEPPNGGVRFQFDTKPSNAYVHRVYFDLLSSTTSHVYIVTNDITRDNFWNTAAFPEGKYVVMVFTEDTRHNADTVYVAVETTGADLTPPAPPVLRFVKEIPAGLAIGWYPNQESDLLGYRLYFSTDNLHWSLKNGERYLQADQQDTSFKAILNRDLYFRLTAVDNAPVPNESQPSDVYGMSNGKFRQKVLIVDGFDRTESSGSWHKPSHFFAFIHGRAIIANGFSFDTVPNEAVVDSTVDLNDYAAVVWFLGDESTADQTFSPEEQKLIAQYLENGGRLFVSGSEIAWDLDPDSQSGQSTPEDETFLHEYLKADYEGNTADSQEVTGVEETIFEGLQFNFGKSPYPEDSPDFIQPFGEGSKVCLKYSTNQNAGVQFEGTFGESDKIGKIVYLAFPFETIEGEEIRKEVMGRILNFFFPNPTAITSGPEANRSPEKFALFQNYPNPFNAHTSITFHVPVNSHVKLTIYNIRGRLIRTLRNGVLPPGIYRVAWDGLDEAQHSVSSGIYLLKMEGQPLNTSLQNHFQQVRRLVFLK